MLTTGASNLRSDLIPALLSISSGQRSRLRPYLRRHLQTEAVRLGEKHNDRKSSWHSIQLSTLLITGLLLPARAIHAQTLPPPEDIPEEVLQTEIITEARSPVDGEPLTAAEYAELQAQQRIAAEDVPGRVSPRIQTNVSLLRLRKVLKSIFPFLIK